MIADPPRNRQPKHQSVVTRIGKKPPQTVYGGVRDNLLFAQKKKAPGKDAFFMVGDERFELPTLSV